MMSEVLLITPKMRKSTFDSSELFKVRVVGRGSVEYINCIGFTVVGILIKFASFIVVERSSVHNSKFLC